MAGRGGPNQIIKLLSGILCNMASRAHRELSVLKGRAKGNVFTQDSGPTGGKGSFRARWRREGGACASGRILLCRCMDKPTDKKRVADAIDALAVTLMEIMGDRLKAIAEAQERRIAEQSWEPMLTKKQLGERFQIDVRTVTSWMKKGYLPYYGATHSVRFKWSEVQKYWEARFRVLRGRPMP